MRKIKDVVAASLLHMYSRETHEDEMAKVVDNNDENELRIINWVIVAVSCIKGCHYSI